MQRWSRSFAAIPAVLAAGALSATAPAQADPIADFYKDKTVTIVVATGPAGSYSLFAQLMMRHIQDKIPGRPKVVPAYMPGGGGTKAANYLYNVSLKDGSAVGMLLDYTVNAQLLRPTGVKYRAERFNWIGRFIPSNPVIVVMRESGVATIADARKRELVMASTGKAAPSYINMSLMNSLFGTRFKIIPGYKDRSTVESAMERGEVAGSSAGWENWTSVHQDWVDSGRIIPLVQVGLVRLRDLPKVPTLIDLATNDADRTLLELISSGGALGRSVTSPPGLPKARVQALRRAFDAMVRDPAFVADAKKRRIAVEPETGEWLQDIVGRAVAAPPAVIERARSLLGT
jgi:tripartite-type tricarboxylate transporter receptor subunit TctC